MVDDAAGVYVSQRVLGESGRACFMIASRERSNHGHFLPCRAGQCWPTPWLERGDRHANFEGLGVHGLAALRAHSLPAVSSINGACFPPKRRAQNVGALQFLRRRAPSGGIPGMGLRRWDLS
jgi:hypothetical protein